MTKNRMNERAAVEEQYRGSHNLKTRMTIHDKYSINKLGFGNWLFQQYELGEEARILELGCGTGDLWDGKLDLLGPGSSLVLSDFSAGMVEAVKNKFSAYPMVSFEQINIEEIPYKEETFDIVIANMMLYHVPDLPKGLEEIRRVLKKNGTFCCATFGENGIQKYLTGVLDQYGIHIDISGAFTLQNGADILGKHFSGVCRRDYIDGLEVTDTWDLLDYIYSMVSIGNIENVAREELFQCFEAQKDEKGMIHIPKEYGMFLCGK